MATVRTRVAPSPTGDPHVGTGYVALFNYCFARQHGGQFILRIEDTDRARSSSASEQMILHSLRWLGLTWDEGPDVGGPHGPYRQSERGAIYARYAQQLLDEGHAFRCFHTTEELDALRKVAQANKQTVFDSDYVGLSRAESDARAAAGDPFVIRMRVPREGTCTIRDRLRGIIEIDWTQVDMQVLLKSDGMPTYHLANVVDDHLMGITHVLRGEEWISSAPKHQLLYQYFGWEMPELCHLPLLRNPDKSKLSKRKNPTSIRFYERAGYLPEALLNFLGRMAWSMPDEAEKFTLDQMLAHFDIDRISLGGPVFDLDKLNWLNGKWIREDLDDAAFADRVQAWAFNREYLDTVVPLVRERVTTFGDLAGLAGFFLAGADVGITAEDLAHKKLEPEQVKQALVWGLWQLDALPAWTDADIQTSLRATCALLELKLRDFLSPYFMAISGSRTSTPLFSTMAVLGRDLTRARIRRAIDLLGGLSKKKGDKWRKALAQAQAAAAEG